MFKVYKNLFLGLLLTDQRRSAILWYKFIYL